jgi:hypothetical protein
MLTLVMHPMLAAMDGRDFENFMRAFLRVGRKSWFNYACAIGMAIAPIVALVTLWDDRGSASFVLTAIGLGFVNPRSSRLRPAAAACYEERQRDDCRRR